MRSSPSNEVKVVRVGWPAKWRIRFQAFGLCSCPCRCYPTVSCRNQRQASGGASLEPTSLCLRPLIAFAGVLLVIGLGSTLYWQGDRFTALLVRSPVTLPQFPAKSLPRINYYVGKIDLPASDVGNLSLAVHVLDMDAPVQRPPRPCGPSPAPTPLHRGDDFNAIRRIGHRHDRM